MNGSLSAVQHAFIAEVFFSSAFNATAQRGRLYRPDPSEEQKDKLRWALKCRVQEIAKSDAYVKGAVSDSHHISTIVQISDDISKAFPDVLIGGRFRIGSSQKLLNVYLKLLWCSGAVPEPPHCPYDAIVNRKIKRPKILWTQLDNVELYKELVTASREVASGNRLTIAHWELKEYGKKDYY
jgi:hypothetical protein